MKFSVLICTRNGARVIDEVIYSIINQTEINEIIEVILVHTLTTDSTCEIVSKILEKTNIQLKEIKSDVLGKSPALTLGLDAALGDFIAIVDDDNILALDYIYEARKILTNANIGLLGSQGIIDENLILPLWFLDYKSDYAIGLPVQDNVTDWVWGAGSIVNKKAWEKLREMGFDFMLNGSRVSNSSAVIGGGDDVELSLALKLLKYEIVISENVKYKHHFPQKRINEDYLLENNRNTCQSVAIHAIYRTILYFPYKNIFLSQLAWHFRIAKNLLACIIIIIISTLKNNKLKRKYYQSTFFGILFGFISYRADFKKIYIYLLKIYEKN